MNKLELRSLIREEVRKLLMKMRQVLLTRYNLLK